MIHIAYPLPLDAWSGFETGDHCVSDWFRNKNLPLVQVTFSGTYLEPNWFKAERGFRKSDQFEMLVLDRHTDLFADASPEQKLELTKIMEGN